jgi:hypothetical protein
MTRVMTGEGEVELDEGTGIAWACEMAATGRI